MHEHDEERTIIQHENGFPMIKMTIFEKTNDRYVFPSQCEQVFYSKVPGKRDWSFVVRYDPRGMPVRYIVYEEDVSSLTMSNFYAYRHILNKFQRWPHSLLTMRGQCMTFVVGELKLLRHQIELGNSIIKPSLSIMWGQQTSLSIVMGVMISLSIMRVWWKKFVMGVLEVPCQISR
jgi:hypothetical protein